jgi:hypothetical protein
MKSKKIDRSFGNLVIKSKFPLLFLLLSVPSAFYGVHKVSRNHYKSEIEAMADRDGDGKASKEEIRREIGRIEEGAKDFGDVSYWQMKRYVDEYRND